MLHGAVFVDVPRDAEPREVADLVGARDRAAEDQNREPAVVDLADRADEFHAARMRQPEIEHDEVDAVALGSHAREQLGRALDGHSRVSRTEQRRREPVPHERRVVGDDDGFGGGHGNSRHVSGIGSICATR